MERGGNGHACGHNLLGSAALLAATAVKNYLAEAGIKGRVRYYGCPAEEGGAAKTFMVRAGCFDDVDIAITWHPGAMNRVDDALSLAGARIDYTFRGRASHAAASPHLGRSALDAVELMSVGVNYMREHMPSDARIHYAVLDSGGVAPNVVQAFAKVRYSIRARDVAGMNALVARVQKVADGAALMTETKVEVKVQPRCRTCSATRRWKRRCRASSSGSGRRRSMRRIASMRPRFRRRYRRKTSHPPTRASRCR